MVKLKWYMEYMQSYYKQTGHSNSQEHTLCKLGWEILLSQPVITIMNREISEDLYGPSIPPFHLSPDRPSQFLEIETPELYPYPYIPGYSKSFDDHEYCFPFMHGEYFCVLCL